MIEVSIIETFLREAAMGLILEATTMRQWPSDQFTRPVKFEFQK